MIRESASRLGYSTHGYDLWMEHREIEADYASLYAILPKKYNTGGGRPLGTTLGWWMDDWAGTMIELLGEASRVKNGENQGVEARLGPS